MTHSWSYFSIILAIWLFYYNGNEADAKSFKVHTKQVKLTNTIIPQHFNYPKRVRPQSVRPIVLGQRNKAVVQYPTQLETRQGTITGSENRPTDIIQSTFDVGIRDAFEYLRKYVSRYFQSNSNRETSEEQNEEETKLRIPGLPTTPLFQTFDTSKIVKLLQATDGSQVEILAEEAVVDFVSQLVAVIGFKDLRDWLGIILMYFILGPILIPLFWLPISLFGMAGLLAPLFFFNPPSKLNTDVLGHDPILPEKEARSLQNFPFNYTTSNQFPFGVSSPPNYIESCMERVSCHLARFYRANPITQWLTSRFNVTTVEWARRLPQDDKENWTSSWEHCEKYSCSIFPAA